MSIKATNAIVLQKSVVVREDLLSKRRERIYETKKVKVKVKLRFSAPSAGTAEIANRKSSPRPFVMMLKGAGGI